MKRKMAPLKKSSKKKEKKVMKSIYWVVDSCCCFCCPKRLKKNVLTDPSVCEPNYEKLPILQLDVSNETSILGSNQNFPSEEIPDVGNSSY